MSLKYKVKVLPSSPGVYLMKDSLNSVIYVGKSKNLKNRVGSYFQNSKSHSPKVLKLIQNLKDFEYILTDTEFEAFMLECKLIKEIKPIYNKQLKSPKAYSYIKIKIHGKYPSIEISNEIDKDDGNIYFGPYTNKNTLERGLGGIKECCRILCNNKIKKTSVCFNYSLGSCIGMCSDNIPTKQYVDILNEIINLINGSDKSIINKMENIMNTASEKYDFESAAKYRDYITAVKYLIGKSDVVKFTKENKNIVLLEPLSNNLIKLFLINGNKVLFEEKYIIDDLNSEKVKIILKNKILFYFNDEIISNSIEVGREEIDESQIIYTYLKSKSNCCKYTIIQDKWLKSPNKDSIIYTSLNKLLSF
ncbi:GIY-YIG nuclease family protein [Clostridium sp. C2-6-12]|uniref:GIY-YIG nuclease family protein n=1 Tax=Clostridium sp. C2-6-12 TaxID=2698832 RepID=UPI00137003DC|nr:GIY-YIG nuclease family protein [Clostridium sp. C2-6-12]